MSQPTSLPGYLDDSQFTADAFGTAVDFVLEQIPELQHPLSVNTFAKMRHDPQIAAVLRAYYLAITRAHWTLDGEGCDPKVTAQIADDLGLPIMGAEDAPTGARRRRFTWAEHLRLALSLSTTFGHAPFAQQWVEENGRWRLLVVQERMPQTIAAIHLNDDGTLKDAEQGGIQKSVKIPTANHQLVWYAREREGSNYFGRSLIREAYAPWLMKTDALRLHMTAIRRFSMGIPEVTAPDNTPASIAQAQRYAQGLVAGAKMGAGVPPGFVTSWKGLQGSVPDAPAFVTMLDRYITRATLTSILDMAVAERGNRSLGETVMDLMVMAQQAEGQRIAEDGTQQIVVPLVDANFGESEPAPRICVSDVGADVELTAQDINWAMQYGGLHSDKPFRDWYRDRYGIPEEDPKDPANQAPPTDPTNPSGGAA